MRLFRAGDKMSAKEPMLLTTAQAWDPIPSILPDGDIVLLSFLMRGTVRRL